MAEMELKASTLQEKLDKKSELSKSNAKAGVRKVALEYKVVDLDMSIKPPPGFNFGEQRRTGYKKAFVKASFGEPFGKAPSSFGTAQTSANPFCHTFPSAMSGTDLPVSRCPFGHGTVRATDDWNYPCAISRSPDMCPRLPLRTESMTDFPPSPFPNRCTWTRTPATCTARTLRCVPGGANQLPLL